MWIWWKKFHDFWSWNEWEMIFRSWASIWNEHWTIWHGLVGQHWPSGIFAIPSLINQNAPFKCMGIKCFDWSATNGTVNRTQQMCANQISGKLPRVCYSRTHIHLLQESWKMNMPRNRQQAYQSIQQTKHKHNLNMVFMKSSSSKQID